MPKEPSSLAVQLYTLRDFTKTPRDIASTLARVKKMGYDAVQCSALGKIDPLELANILRGEGLTCCATHTPMDRLSDEINRVIDEHHLWGCKYIATGGFFPKDPKAVDWKDFAGTYNKISENLEGTGISLGYHNHSHELARFGEKTGLQIMLDHFRSDIWMEIDTYWIQHGGGDPAEWISRFPGRVPCVHLKDMTINNDRVQLMAEVGEGNLNWPRILKACRDVGVKWYIIEQDICQRDPFESLAISLKNAREMGLR
jgi:sugar phosphate isomerase/epimerase